MRNKHIFLGMVSNIFSNLMSSILGFVSRTLFIYFLGAEYLGYSGLLNNIFGFLSIAELGVGTAITFSLYEPLANKDNEKVSMLMTLYKKVYRLIAGFVFFLGLVFFPFLDFFIESSQRPENIEIIYFLFLFNIVTNYLVSYKISLLNADQQSYKLTLIQVSGNVITIIMQIVSLIIFKDYIIYLIVQIILSNISLIIQSEYVKKLYPKINFNYNKKLDKKDRKVIVKNIKSLMILKLGDVCVNSTDNLIISKYVNLMSVGVYSNYILIRNMVNGYIKAIYSNMTSSFGNLIVSEGKEKQLKMFENLMFLSFWIYGFESVCLFTLYNPFMKIWLNDVRLVFSDEIVFLIVLNNFLTGLRMPSITIKNAAGLYYEDRIVSFVFAIVNLFVSIVLVKKIGISGVIIGTIIGSLSLADWYRPKIIYNKLFDKSVFCYFKKYIRYIFIVLIEIFISFYFSRIIVISNNIILQFCFQMIIAIFIPNFINFILFNKSEEFLYLKSVILMIFYNIRKKKSKGKEKA